MDPILGAVSPTLLTNPVVARLFAEEFLSKSDVVSVALKRMELGEPQGAEEQALALLLSDDLGGVPEFLGPPPHTEALSPVERQTYLLYRLRQIRSTWDSLVEPQFYIEDLLDEFDKEGLYQEERFFEPYPRHEPRPRFFTMPRTRRERGMARYTDDLDRAILSRAIQLSELGPEALNAPV